MTQHPGPVARQASPAQTPPMRQKGMAWRCAVELEGPITAGLADRNPLANLAAAPKEEKLGRLEMIGGRSEKITVLHIAELLADEKDADVKRSMLGGIARIGGYCAINILLETAVKDEVSAGAAIGLLEKMSDPYIVYSIYETKARLGRDAAMDPARKDSVLEALDAMQRTIFMKNEEKKGAKPAGGISEEGRRLYPGVKKACDAVKVLCRELDKGENTAGLVYAIRALDAMAGERPELANRARAMISAIVNVYIGDDPKVYDAAHETLAGMARREKLSGISEDGRNLYPGMEKACDAVKALHKELGDDFTSKGYIRTLDMMRDIVRENPELTRRSRKMTRDFIMLVIPGQETEAYEAAHELLADLAKIKQTVSI